ncbi:hypothetical protein H8S90_09510 [Olivibacter sp. SDN3]|uniref:hypothetical protein n=1 Tax=Olivibacter sp. SDN3 TaxID=2764720 RepID=UPI0016518BBF|nr:hypothetical protein [Olivibacter sp. SDN3]QNL51785.1 hypothetical protein H8S90_09510 [Olivibacter sp. SDN3]
MKLYIPKISLKTLSEKELERYHMLDSRAFGKGLAYRVAAKLTRSPNESGGLYFAHRDYCGMGLYLNDGQFTLGTVYDGRGPFPIVATFESEKDFSQWLAEQSDQSMALYGEKFDNQTITKIRLEWYLEEHYSTSWNAYCHYIRIMEKL